LDEQARKLREQWKVPASPFELCNTKPATNSELTLTKLFPQLETFAPTQMRIVKGWSGFSPSGPTHAEYILNFENGQFSHAEPTEARRDDMMGFVRVALQVAIEEKPYIPRICYTDSYPSLEITLQSGTQTLRIWSTSQGWTPWGIEFGNRSFVADTLQLEKALGPLAVELGFSLNR
jgi:hypothetical protein